MTIEDRDAVVDERAIEAGVALVVIDLESKVVHWNRRAEQLYGWSTQEALGRPVGELIVADEDAEVSEQIIASIRTAGSWSGEFWVRRKDGTRLLVHVHDVALHGDDGAPVGMVGVAVDIPPP
jgi:PAS domain S-box-containing protein